MRKMALTAMPKMRQTSTTELKYVMGYDFPII